MICSNENNTIALELDRAMNVCNVKSAKDKPKDCSHGSWIQITVKESPNPVKLHGQEKSTEVSSTLPQGEYWINFTLQGD